MSRVLSPALAPTRQRLQINKCVKNIKWTKEEDETLIRLVAESDAPNWSTIALSFPQKSTQQVTERWEKVLNPALVKGSWTREEDEIIVRFVREFGPKNWTRLAALLKGRIGKQCRERWRNHLDPSINHAVWTPEEDQLLIELHRQYGNSWVKISKQMPGRCDNQIKNRWNSALKKLDVTNGEAEISVPAAPFVQPLTIPVTIKHSPVDFDANEDTKSSPRVPSIVEQNRAKLILLMEE